MAKTARAPAELIALDRAFPPQSEDRLSVTITVEVKPFTALSLERRRRPKLRLVRTED